MYGAAPNVCPACGTTAAGGGGHAFCMNGAGAGGPGGPGVWGRPTLDAVHVAIQRERVYACIDAAVAVPTITSPGTNARVSVFMGPQRVKSDLASVAWTPLVASTACVT